MNYGFLKPFVSPPKNPELKTVNWFFPVSSKEIQDVEEELGIVFPSQLKEFYKEVGYGSLKVPHNAPLDYNFPSANCIYAPEFIRDIFVLGLENEFMSQDTYEMLEPGDLPFFEIGDSSRFLVMKLNSDNPNAVWKDGFPVKIEDSFELFIWRLYYEDTAYYDDIITADLKKRRPDLFQNE